MVKDVLGICVALAILRPGCFAGLRFRFPSGLTGTHAVSNRAEHIHFGVETFVSVIQDIKLKGHVLGTACGV